MGGLILVVLDLVGHDDLEQFRAETLILKDPLLLAKLLLPSVYPALKQPPLPHAAVQVRLQLSVLRQKGGAQEDSLSFTLSCRSSVPVSHP